MVTEIIQIALNEVGTQEIQGLEDNPAVMKYYHDIGHDWVDNDEVAWCSAYANWVCKEAGYEHTGSLSARSWLEIGEPTHEPEVGDIVVLWRINPYTRYGHVGFFIRELDGYIYILGGNQNNEVRISKYSKQRLLSYRKLRKI